MTPAVVSAKPTRARSPIVAFTSSWASQIGITVAFLLVWSIFIIGAPSTFLSDRIYLAFAQTIPYFAVACLASGALCGLFNGFFVAIVGIPALVVTIATWYLFGGLTLVLVNGRSYPLVDTTGSFSYGLLAGKIGTIPIPFFWLIAMTIVAWLLLNRHRLGQNAYVVGDNAQAAQLMGIPIRRTRITLFVLVGMASALGALMNAFSLTNFYPNLGASYQMMTLAAVFVGGTSVFGGRGTVYGTLLGVFMIGGIQAGIVAVGLTDYYTQAIYGAIILSAVTIHVLMQRRFE
jgi:simple sugar transport system permease protein